MDVSQLLAGFAAVLTVENLLLVLAGCMLGTLIGVLPGVGPVAGTAILIPLTMDLEPTGAIIMLAAIFYGSQYGGTITSVLINTPGEASSAITVLDGYEMTKQGRAGIALGIAAIGSFVGGTIATVGLVIAAGPLATLGLRIGPPEFFALMVLGMSLLVGLAGRSMTKALISAAVGLLLAMVGIDPVEGLPRFTFGITHFFDGVEFVAVLVGLFGLGEILATLMEQRKPVGQVTVGRLLPDRKDLRDSTGAIGRGSLIGFLLGLVPGVTGSASSLLAYGAERKFGRNKAMLGKGAIQGVASPESANNAHANAALIPLFTLGVPGSPTIAVLMGAFLMNGLTPGPTLFQTDADVAWAVIASLFVGNLVCLVLNLPLIRVWTMILKIPQPLLIAIIIVFLVVGSYSINNSTVDVLVMFVFGLVGLAFRRLDIPLAPLVLTLILGPFMESALRESLDMSRGEMTIFLTRPISLVLLLVAAAIVVVPVVAALRGRGTSGEQPATLASRLREDAEV
jgi:putative tricarboxylic transport membrane protein